MANQQLTCAQINEDNGMKTSFEMTEEQEARLLEASQSVPYLIVDGVSPRSPQENANTAWQSLGAVMGFKFMTVEPIPGKGIRYFRAEKSDA